MKHNIFFGKFITGNITRFSFHYLGKKVCQECQPFIKKGSTILDLGCGRGEITSIIKKHFNSRVTGVDIQDARMKHDFPFYLVNSEHLPFNGQSFNIVFIRYVLHHSPNPILLLKEAKRMTKGKIIIYENLPEGLFSAFFCKLHGLSFNFFLQPKFKKYSFYTTQEWQRIFDDLGLRVIHKEKFLSGVGSFYLLKNIFFVLEKK